MNKIVLNGEFFNPEDTLFCGQVFRYRKYDKGYLLISLDKICYIYTDGEYTVIETEDEDYFRNYFDLSRSYAEIYNKAINYGNETLNLSAKSGKGIRILKQDAFEMLFTFIISQNNNVKRISLIIERLCEKVGKKVSSPFISYNAFPKLEELSTLTEKDYKELGFGYRGNYFIKVISALQSGVDVEKLKLLADNELYNALTSLHGVGDKVANCIMLFGFFRTKTFPVDTWIEKIYINHFNGKLKDRKKIAEWFIAEFGEYSGYIQQYLFNFIRNKKGLL